MSDISNHIRIRRIWAYVQMQVELSTEEQAHLASCDVCMSAFRVCILSDKQPADEDDKASEQSA